MEKIEYKRGILIEEDETESEKIEIGKSRTGRVSIGTSGIGFEDQLLHLSTRAGGEFEGKALYLPCFFDWVLCKDNANVICLIPLKKEKK